MDYSFFIHAAQALPAWLSFPLSFIAPIVGGELGVMAAAFVAAEGYFPMWIVVLGGTLGMLALDSFWFFVARSRFFIKLKEKITSKNKQFTSLEKKIERSSHGKDMLILMISKMLIGTRILIILYISNKKISYWKFMAFDAPPTFFWAIVLSFLGYLAGRVSFNLFQSFEHISIVITFMVAFAAAVYAGLRLLRLWFTKKDNK